jgi:hypothetical protein
MKTGKICLRTVFCEVHTPDPTVTPCSKNAKDEDLHLATQQNGARENCNSKGLTLQPHSGMATGLWRRGWQGKRSASKRLAMVHEKVEPSL